VEFIAHENHEVLSRHAADLIAQSMARKADLLLCAATGNSPARTYQLLAGISKDSPRLFKALRVVKLDEWIGLGAEHAGSCERFLRRYLLEPLEIGPERYAGFNGCARDSSLECARVGQWLTEHGPIDLCLLGLGINGHIALNEPGELLVPHAHVATLAETTRRHGMLATTSPAPTHGLTLGMAELMAASQILLLVSGATKRDALQQLKRREMTTRFPASLLWLHPRCTVLFDAAAAGSTS
jgi:galactosamine-6-phosphate isomerase